MQAIQRENALIGQELRMDLLECFQIRETLDAFWVGISSLETAPTETKQGLFKHLETCALCCRSFDVRFRRRSSQRNRIY
jgi:hypothetical protein